MCGIVLAGTKTTLTANEVGVFQKLLFCDTFRGEHSTGVYSVFKDGKEMDLIWAKEAVPGDQFSRSPLFKEVSEREEYTVTSTGKTYTKSIVRPSIMVGHNRYATQGAINAKNAHPFTHGHITLVHNGTLIDQGLLPDSKDFEVDSENICHSIAKIGIDETVQKLDGAFTLVWFDDNEKTLNILRNEERPFHLAETNTGEWYGASEEEMLMWILNRKKYSPTVKRHFECEVGVQYIFDATNMTLKEEKKHTLPTFPKYSYWNRSYDDDNLYNYGNYSKKSFPNKVNAKDPHAGVNAIIKSVLPNKKIGDRIIFEALDIRPYGRNSDRAQLIGWINNEDEYIEIQCHGIRPEEVEREKSYSAEITSAYFMNHCVHIMVKDLKNPNEVVRMDASAILVDLNKKLTNVPEYVDDTVEEIIDSLSEDTPTQELTTVTGETFTEQQWIRKGDMQTCANCSSPIDFEDIPETIIVHDVAFCCDECYTEVMGTHLDNKVVEKEVCRFCANEFDPSEMSTTDVSCCKECEKVFKSNQTGGDTAFRKTLRNGFKVSKSNWEKMNECSSCFHRIPWSEAPLTSFQGQKPICPNCQGVV